MQLYNCATDLELELKSLDLKELSINALKILMINIKTDFMSGVLENEIIVVDALSEIALEFARRI